LRLPPDPSAPRPPAPGLPAEPGSGESSPPAAASASPDLPTVVVAPRPVHKIQEDEAAAPKPFTLRGRDGQVMHRPAVTSPAVATAATASPARPQGSSGASPVVGAAQVTAAATLMVRGQPTRLFGVRTPDPRDRCSPGQGAPRPCGDVARDALAARLAAGAAVSCRIPPGQHRPEAGAVCRDATGVDLGGFLVAEGFALADPLESYDYVGAEGVARSFRRGLWRYR
jgi:endonuclease YncB( thermonuclease family)